MDAMAGTTSQPSMGALASSLLRTPLDTGLDMDEITLVNDYWEECRGLYAPFESGQKSGSADVYNHEMPGAAGLIGTVLVYENLKSRVYLASSGL